MVSNPVNGRTDDLIKITGFKLQSDERDRGRDGDQDGDDNGRGDRGRNGDDHDD
jgi:hypothetical protein